MSPPTTADSTNSTCSIGDVIIRGVLGIDNGTQGLSIIFCKEDTLEVLASGETEYSMVPGLENGCYEQHSQDWQNAMVEAMKQVKEKLLSNQDNNLKIEVLAIGISGQMHGEVLQDERGNVLQPVRIWCDSRNENEGIELTKKLNHKVPKRMTSARFLWTIRNRANIASRTKHITTVSGYMSYILTEEYTLGIGDASGIFPIDQNTMTYDEHLLKIYDDIVEESDPSNTNNIAPLKTLLPKVCVAGEPAGYLSSNGAKLLGLPEGIPVAPAEGDQPAALAGSLIGRAGTVSLSFGTSVCANSVGDRQFEGVSPAVDHFCAADGKPINMVWLRNGTTFMNTVVSSYGDMTTSSNSGSEKSDFFAAIMPKVVQAPPDCGGLIALPFMDDEPGLNVSKGGSAMIIGWNQKNANPGNVAKAALLSTCFNLRKGSKILDKQGYPRTELVLTGGLAKTPECGQIVADVFDTPCTLLVGSSDEGSCFGASLMAVFLCRKLSGKLEGEGDWASFLDSLQESGSSVTRYEPIPSNVEATNKMYNRYKKLLSVVPELTNAVHLEK